MTLPESLTSLLRRHPALLVTVGYLAVSLTGLIFSWAFFRRFDVNYFLFADLSDFLLGAVREPVALFFGLGAIALIWLLYRYGEWELTRLERRENRGRFLNAYIRMNRSAMRSGWITLLLVFLYGFAMVTMYANWRAEAVREGEGTQVTLHADGDALSLTLMGASARYLFLFDVGSQEVVIVPDEGVSTLRIRSEGDDAPAPSEVEPIDDPPPAEPAEVDPAD